MLRCQVGDSTPEVPVDNVRKLIKGLFPHSLRPSNGSGIWDRLKALSPGAVQHSPDGEDVQIPDLGSLKIQNPDFFRAQPHRTDDGRHNVMCKNK